MKRKKKKKERETQTEGGGEREVKAGLFVCLWKEIFLNTLRHADDSVSVSVNTH